MERRLSRGKGTDESARNFALGFFNASLLFCSGAMTVVGSIQAGTVGDYQLIMIKAIMDGAMAIIFTAAYGIGVMASALFILVYQGFFTLAGGFIAPAREGRNHRACCCRWYVALDDRLQPLGHP